MKRGALLFVLILGIVVLASCAPKPEEVNAVVTEFWNQLKANNPAGMVATMTAEVDCGMMSSKGIPALDLAEELANDMPIDPNSTFSIITTNLYDCYAVVDGVIDPDPSTTDDEFTMTLHLRDTNDGWKICLIMLHVSLFFPG